MSVAKDQLNAAVVAHGNWKTKLNQAIESGSSEANPATVAMDNQCAFGKWLYGEIDASLKSSPFYEEIRTKHAAFHKKASEVLQLAVSGQKDAALAQMQFGSEFMSMSSELINTISKWRDSLAE